MNDQTPHKTQKNTKTHGFVTFIIDLCQKDKGMAARLRRADNINTEYQSWEVLARFVELDHPWERLPYATVAAAIAKIKKAKIEENGSIGIGSAIANCYDEKSESAQAIAKLRRLLACESVEETCRILRPLFSLIESKNHSHLDFTKLLGQLVRFQGNSQQVKSEWAMDFYRQKADPNPDGANR